MRLNNRNKAVYYNFIVSVVAMLLFCGIVAFLLEKYIYNLLGWESGLFLIIPILFAAVFYFRGRQIFEYDSDGEALNFKNRNVVSFLDKALNDEFPKYKLISYEIVDAIILKRLYITISSKRNNSVILKYDISYLNKKELNDLKISLSKVVKNNREQKRENIS